MRRHDASDEPPPLRRSLPRRLPLLVVALLCACGSTEPAALAPAQPGAKEAVVSAADARAGAEQALAALSARVLEEYLRDEPVRATEAGDHRYDAAWPDVTEQGEAARRRAIEGALAELLSVPAAQLGLQSRVDAAMIENQLRSALFAIDELREATWNPMVTTGLVGDGLDPLITRSFAPLEERLRSLGGRLSGVPALVRAAKQRLTGAPPRIHTETAIAQNQGLIALCKTDLPELFASAPAQRAELDAAARAAAAALEDFQAFLEKELLPRSNGDFRLGRARFEKKLRFALDDATIDIDGVVRSARALLAQTHAEMLETSRELWPTLFGKQPFPRVETQDEKMAAIRRVLDAIATERPTNATIVKESDRLLAAATAFVRERDLVRIPEEPCQVIEMPEYRRGVAVAYCDASGPLEAKQETFFAIAPTPKDWPAARVDSFYREYNTSMLADLTVHEAMPGHFLQLMHNNRFPSKIRAVFSSGPFVEGWAVYTEWLMSHHGFGGPKVRMQRQKMVLRLSVNAILDHGVHAGAMDEKEALALMTKDAFQEEGEAVGKWRRARLTSAQLTTYYHGFAEMMRLRAEHQAKPGFSERAYHDRLLSYGSPSVRHLAALLAE